MFCQLISNPPPDFKPHFPDRSVPMAKQHLVQCVIERGLVNVSIDCALKWDISN